MEELEREEHHGQNTLVHTVTTEHHATTMATIYWNSVQRMISFITNTFFEHRASQVYTWYKWSDINVSSQIDFTLVRTRMRSHISDSRAIPNAGLDTDHRPVITTLTTQKKKSTTKRKKQPERINTHKLQDEDVKTQVRNTIIEKLDGTDPSPLNVEEAWNIFKTALQDTIRETCGTKKIGGKNRKATA